MIEVRYMRKDVCASKKRERYRKLLKDYTPTENEKRIHELLMDKENDYTQEKMAEIVGLTRQRVHQILSGMAKKVV